MIKLTIMNLKTSILLISYFSREVFAAYFPATVPAAAPISTYPTAGPAAAPVSTYPAPISTFPAAAPAVAPVSTYPAPNYPAPNANGTSNPVIAATTVSNTSALPSNDIDSLLGADYRGQRSDSAALLLKNLKEIDKMESAVDIFIFSSHLFYIARNLDLSGSGEKIWSRSTEFHKDLVIEIDKLLAKLDLLKNVNPTSSFVPRSIAMLNYFKASCAAENKCYGVYKY